MRVLGFFVGVPFVASVVSGLTQHARAVSSDVDSMPVLKKFIVEAHESASLDDLVSKVEARGARVVKRFQSDVFTGLSIESHSDNIDTLQETQEVTKAWPVNHYRLSPKEETTSFSSDAAASNWSVHWATGVDQAHAAGIYGKGVRIAVIDSGIDYNHRAFGSGFGSGFKVAGGYDLVGNSYQGGLSAKAPDSDPMDQLGHGTHVAGIVAGKTDSFLGVAPEATLLAYKVFGAGDGTTDDILIDATLMAYAANVDIITSSIGRAAGFSHGAWAEVCSRIVDKGVVVTISAGNDGESGPFYASTGSSGENVLSVASVDTGGLPALPWRVTFTLNNATNSSVVSYIQASDRDAWNISGYPLYYVNNTTEGCALLSNLSDPAKAVILVPTSAGYVYTMHGELEKCGAQWILIGNDDSLGFALNNYLHKAGMVLIDKEASAAIAAASLAGAKMTADFNLSATDNSWSVGFREYNGGIPSYYTSWGGTYELDVKPDVAAPGTDIWSTLPNNTWGVKSGTSMATPYVAGVAALYIGLYGGRSTHGEDFAKQLTDRIISSGKSMMWQVLGPNRTPTKYTQLAPVPQVGSGLINATKVLNFTTSLRFDRMALNDTNNFRRYHKVAITNSGASDVVYTFSLEAAGGFNAQGRTASLLGDILDTAPRDDLVPTVSFPSSPFRVAAGQTKTAQFNFMYPDAGDTASQLPIYSGKVLIAGDNGEVLAVPYFGAAFDLKKELRGQFFPEGYPHAQIGPDYEDLDTHASFTFNVSLAAQDFPKVVAQFMWGVDELRWDLYDTGFRESDWQYPPVVGENHYVGSATYSVYADYAGHSQFDPATMDRENVLPFPRSGLARSETWNEGQSSLWWLGKLANGSYIAPGQYIMRFAAQLPFSNPEHSDNWQIWKTPTIEVLPYTV